MGGKRTQIGVENNLEKFKNWCLRDNSTSSELDVLERQLELVEFRKVDINLILFLDQESVVQCIPGSQGCLLLGHLDEGLDRDVLFEDENLETTRC